MSRSIGKRKPNTKRCDVVPQEIAAAPKLSNSAQKTLSTRSRSGPDNLKEADTHAFYFI